MKKLAVLAIAAVFLSILIIGGVATAGPSAPPTLNWGSETNAGECGAGKLVLNVTQTIVNDIDSGEDGNYWAYDNYNRHIQVWQVGTNAFCALVKYMGSFTSVAGSSPGNTTDVIAAGISGTMEGGYKATITGTLNASPTYRTRGNIGVFNYGCDPSSGSCTGRVSWLDVYFSSWSFPSGDLDWWGWIYHGEPNGTWVNAVTGNLGDITD